MRRDAHVHVFHPGSNVRPERRYAPTYAATAADLLAQLDANGMDGALLVQPSFLADHDDLLQALAEHPDRFRGVVAPASLPELRAGWEQWCDHGVSGVRLNLVGRELPDLGDREWTRVGRDLADAGMHLEVHATGEEWGRLAQPLHAWPSAVVIDHLGRTDDIATMRRLGERDHVWLKVSAPYRWTDVEGAERLVRELLGSTGGRRLLWGSDWPFTQHEDEVTYVGMVTAMEQRFPELVGMVDDNLQRLTTP